MNISPTPPSRSRSRSRSRSASRSPASPFVLDHQFLLRCTQVRVPDERVPLLRALARQVRDWPALLALAGYHGSSGLLHLNLERHCRDLAPAEALAHLARERERTAVNNLRLLSELQQIVAACERAAIPVLPYKGPALALELYPDVSLRPSGDLDVLVPPSCFEAAGALLEARGYRRDERVPDDFRLLEVPYLHPETGIAVELHSRLDQVYQLDPLLDGVWRGDHRVPRSLMGQSITAFAPEALLVALCVHGARHHWLGLKWIADVVRLFERYPDLDAGRALELARRSHCEHVLLLGLLVAHELLGLPLPSALPDPRRDRRLTATLRWVGERLFDPERHRPGPLQRFRFASRVQRDPLRHLAAGVFLARLGLRPYPVDREFLPLPERLDFLYLLVRPVRLLSRPLLRRFTRGEASRS